MPEATANTAFGRDALGSNTSGRNNTASGAFALISNDTGKENTATGRAALAPNTTGVSNTGNGSGALFFNTLGNGNTALGANALLNSQGNKNISIGFSAGSNLTSGNNNIYLGNAGGSTESHTIRIGKAQTQTFIAGIANAGVNNGAPVMIDATTGQLGLLISSARYKRDILPMGTQSAKVLALWPVTFAYKDDATRVTHYGLIAEEVVAVYPELVTRTAAGDVLTVQYLELIPILLNELQRQQQQLADLPALKQELGELRAVVERRRLVAAEGAGAIVTEGGPASSSR